jgi:hypothetical protein
MKAFAPILEPIEFLKGLSQTWFVSGGWAIDLFLRNVTRAHAVTEIGIYRSEQDVFRRQFPNWLFDKAIQTQEGRKWVRWAQTEELRLPIHQVRATSPGAKGARLEFFLNERTETHWVSRRHPELTRPLDEVVIMSFLDLPILAPEVQLYFKAEQTRPKDQADFELTVPRLNSTQRTWLASALHKHHPDHAWLEAFK